MKLVVNHLTYHDSSVEVRERVTFTAEQRRAMLRQMHRQEQIGEAVILHGPIRFIKNGGGEPSTEQLQAIDMLNRMFFPQETNSEG